MTRREEEHYNFIISALAEYGVMFQRIVDRQKSELVFLSDSLSEEKKKRRKKK